MLGLIVEVVSISINAFVVRQTPKISETIKVNRDTLKSIFVLFLLFIGQTYF